MSREAGVRYFTLDPQCQLIDPLGPLVVRGPPPKEFSQAAVEWMAEENRALLPLDPKFPEGP
jgi:hypothetical protein